MYPMMCVVMSECTGVSSDVRIDSRVVVVIAGVLVMSQIRASCERLCTGRFGVALEMRELYIS